MWRIQLVALALWSACTCAAAVNANKCEEEPKASKGSELPLAQQLAQTLSPSERQQRLRERDRFEAETKKLRTAGKLSGLVLAGANLPVAQDADDGILTALEVAELDLSGMELAALSACETGLGKTAGGEGLLGLQRAFQTAGARSVVASLWQVDDEATRKLMVRFYENLWQKKMGRLAALREAQRWVMQEGPKRGLHRPNSAPPLRVAPPYYWAAFVLSGDWR